MDIKAALEAGGICDITTIGAKSGQGRRIEIVFHNIDGDFYITGQPISKRDWMANLKANPQFTIHLKKGISADLQAKATPVTGQEERAKVLYRILTEGFGNAPDKAKHILNRWVRESPLVEFELV